MKEYLSRNKMTISQAMIYFMLYSIIGWCYEVFLEVVVYRWGFTNRGVLFGPYTPVYGFGALAFLLTVYPMLIGKPRKEKLMKLPIVFLACMGIATAIELFTSYLLEWTTGSWSWQTYADYGINFQARIALNPSVRFGLGGILFLYVLQPQFEKLCAALGQKRTNVIAVCLCAILCVDSGVQLGQKFLGAQASDEGSEEVVAESSVTESSTDDDDEKFTEEELLNFSIVDDAILEVMNSEEYKDGDPDTRRRLAEALMKKLEVQGYVMWWIVEDSDPSEPMLSFQYGNGGLGGWALYDRNPENKALNE